MQFVEGVTLRSQIDSGGMDFRRVANIIRQVVTRSAPPTRRACFIAI